MRLEELGLLPAAAEPDVQEEENVERVAPQEPRQEVVVVAETDAKFGAVGPQEARESGTNDGTQTVGSVQVAVAPTEVKPKDEAPSGNVSIGTPTVPIVNPANPLLIEEEKKSELFQKSKTIDPAQFTEFFEKERKGILEPRHSLYSPLQRKLSLMSSETLQFAEDDVEESSKQGPTLATMAAARRLGPSLKTITQNPLAKSMDKLNVTSSLEASSKFLLDIRETRIRNRQSSNASFISSGSSASTVRGNYSATGYDR